MTRRNRPATEAKLIQAVDDLVTQGQFDSLRVNAIARHAEVNKALIYRYFGNLQGLLTAYTTHKDLWPPVSELLGDDIEAVLKLQPPDLLQHIFTRYIQALRDRPHTIELLALECVQRNPLIIALEDVREQSAMDLVAFFQTHGIRSTPDLHIFTMTLSATIHYFLIRSRSIRIFSGVNIQEDAFWNSLFPLWIGRFAAPHAPSDTAGQPVTPPIPSPPNPPTGDT